MRSTPDDAAMTSRRLLVALLCALALRAGAQDAASAPASAPATPQARAAAVAAAASALRADPDLWGRHKTRTLKWKDDDERKPEKKKPEDDASLWKWLGDFGRFMSDTSRLLVYGLAIVLVALLAVGLRDLVQLRTLARRRAAAAGAVSHVRDLDVRPESLPDDVGAAAWALWQAGQVPAALSLLYRGALSRLIHRFAVPIGAATTEGECLELSRGIVGDVAQRYLTQLVRAREANTYGGRTLSAAMGEALCTGFASRLDATPAAAQEAA
jgi:hypothetical protein